MPAGDFKTVADELLHVAADAEQHFRGLGYKVDIESRRLGFPFIPTLVCSRRHEMLIVEVTSRLEKNKALRWTKFCRSQTLGVKFIIVIREPAEIDMDTVNYAVKNRLGLLVHNDEALTEVRSGADLGVHVDLPDLADLDEDVRPLLAPAFKKIEEGDWRDGLNEAYLETEQAARDYLKAGVISGKTDVIALRKGKQVKRSSSEIEKMTMGQLSVAYSNIKNQTHKDAEIGSTLAAINETRVGLAHKRRDPAVEAKVRLEAGQHMYAVIACLELIVSTA